MARSRGRPNHYPAIVIVMVMLVVAKPAWRMFEQRFACGLLGPGVSVASCSVLNRAGVAHIDSVAWSRAIGDNRELHFASEEVWARYSTEQLLRKRFHFPDIRAEGVSIRLDAHHVAKNAGDTPTVASRWREELDRQLIDLKPERLVANSKLARAATEMRGSWDKQFTAWHQQGTQYLDRSRRLDAQVREMGANPLRSEPELFGAIAQLQSLALEIDRVGTEIKDAEKHVDGYRRTLTTIRQNDQAEFDDRFAQAPRAIGESFGDAMVCEWFRACWHKHAGFCEAIDLTLGDGSLLRTGSARGIDRRPMSQDAPLVAVRDAAARGVIQLGDQRVPFRARGRHMVRTDAPSRPQSTWRVECEIPRTFAVVVVKSEDSKSDARQRIVVASYSISDSAGEPLSAHSSSTTPATSTTPSFHIDCLSRDGELAGTGVIDIRQWTKETVGEGKPDRLIDASDFPAEESGLDSLAVHVRVGGTWGQPTVELIDQAPKWIARKLEAQYQSEMRGAQELAKRLLDERLAVEIQALTRLVSSRRTETLGHWKQFRQQFATLYENVQRDLWQRSGQGFVRRGPVASPITR